MLADQVLDVAGVVVRYGERTVVDGASFTMSRARVLALLGANGAGKTSLLQVCEGFRRPDAGQVRVLGLDPWTGRSVLMPRLGIMLQSGGVYPTVRAGEILQLLASFARQPVPVDTLAERLGLTGFLRTPYRLLSGGEKQRLGLAMALVGRPELVLLDEPTAGMDTHARHATWQLIDELRGDGVSVLLTTHLLDEAERLADDVVIIDAGRVAAAGSPAELTAAAGVEQLHVHADGSLPVRELVDRLPDLASATELEPGHYRFTGTLEAGTVAAICGWYADQKAHLSDLYTRRRTLEEVFLTLVDRDGVTLVDRDGVR
jgi:ABC-2 type transport system ATP-binding protein